MHRLSLSLAGLLVIAVAASPTQAHKTEVSGNVAGMWHLEPNHSPRAGELAQVWVALTQAGGQKISLAECDCRLAVYNANQPGAAPVLEPTLTAMSPETFQSVPGAAVVFPAVGEYRLVLSGRPRASATFTPFELSYTTVVAAGGATATPPQADPQPGETAPDPAIAPPSAPVARSRPSLWGLGGGAGAGLLAIALWRWRSSHNA
jgi:hypothetical protein